MCVQPAWCDVASRLAAACGGWLGRAGTLGKPRADRLTWAVESDELGPLVVKARYGDRADEKTRWTAANLPLLAARVYPAPEIVWHGPFEREWYLVVERRLPGSSLHSLDPPVLDALLELVELQACAGIDPAPRDFAAYQSYVLFDGWDHIWRDAQDASPEASVLCARLRRWLRPVRDRRLPGVGHRRRRLGRVRPQHACRRPGCARLRLRAAGRRQRRREARPPNRRDRQGGRPALPGRVPPAHARRRSPPPARAGRRRRVRADWAEPARPAGRGVTQEPNVSR